MSYDRQQWRDSLKRRQSDAVTVMAAPTSFQMPPQAAVLEEQLMADPHWRVYQQLLQGAVERMKVSRLTLLTRLAQPMDAVQTASIQCEVARHDGSIMAMESAISLPRQLAESAAKASESLESAVTKITGESAHADDKTSH